MGNPAASRRESANLAVAVWLLQVGALAGGVLLVWPRHAGLPEWMHTLTHGAGWLSGAALLTLTVGLALCMLGHTVAAVVLGLAVATFSICHWIGLCRQWEAFNTSMDLSLLIVSAALILCGPWRTMRQRPIVIVLIGATVFSLALLGVTLFIVRGGDAGLAASNWRLPPALAFGLACIGVALGGIGWRIQEQLRPTIHDLRASILIAATWGCVLLTVLSASLATAPLYERLRQKHHDDLRLAARHRAIEMEQYLDRIRTLATQIGSRTRARELLNEHRSGHLSFSSLVRQTRAILGDAMGSSRELLAIRRLDHTGRPVVTLNGDLPALLWEQMSADAASLRWIGPIGFDDHWALGVVCPIVGWEDDRLGVDQLLVSMEEVERLLLLPSELGRSARISLAVLEPTGMRVGRVQRGPGRRIEWNHDGSWQEVRQTLVQGDVTYAALLAMPTESRLAAARMIRGSNWAVIIDVDARELYASDTARVSLVFCVVLIVAGLGALTVLRLVRPLTGGIGDAATSLEDRARVADEELRATQYRLRVAREIQFQLFPVDAPEVCGYQIAGASFAAETVDGDYYDYLPMPDGSTVIAIGDACGHGFGASLLMAETRAALWAVTRSVHDLGAVLTQTNAVLAQAMPASRFVTLALLRIEPRTHQLTYAAAGHPSALVFNASGQLLHRLASVGLPLGVVPHESYQTSVLPPLAPGDTIVMVTDGLMEARNAHNQSLGSRRLEQIVIDHICDRPLTLIESIYDAVLHHADDNVDDDITIVVVRRDGTGEQT